MNAQLRQKIETVVAKAHGWCTLEKALGMAGLVLGTQPKIVVELGVFGGRSLIPMALAMQELNRDRAAWAKGVVFGIDPWNKEACLEGANDIANDKWWSKLNLEDIYVSCRDLVEQFELATVCYLVRQRSEIAAETLVDTIDILHIDGNHSELTSCRDVELWLPKVRRGGFVWADDLDWATTQKAVGILERDCERIANVGNCGLFVKV